MQYRKISKLKDDYWVACFAETLVVGGPIWIVMAWCIRCAHYFSGSETEQIANENVIAIIYGAVGVFIALMIPIHYTISLDILGKINSAESQNLNEEQKKAKSRLLFYCHSAEVLVYAFGLFGASVFLEEAIVIASIFHLAVWPPLHWLLVIAYGFALAAGVSSNRYYRKKWFKSETYDKLNVYYLCTRYVSLTLGAIWIAFLTSSKCANINAVVALILLILYYLCWVMLRLLFAPMTYTRELLIGTAKRTQKGTWKLNNEKNGKSVTLTLTLTQKDAECDN